jgi:N-acetylmuramoyl-L-alanine amidase
MSISLNNMKIKLFLPAVLVCIMLFLSACGSGVANTKVSDKDQASQTATGQASQTATHQASSSEEVVKPNAALKEQNTATANVPKSVLDQALVASANTSANKDTVLKKDAVLKGIVICIDPGHQKRANLKMEPLAPESSEMKYKVSGGTSGVITKIPENQLTLDVAMLLKTELEKLGATVIMTRDKNDVDISNVARAEIANAANADLNIRLHADGSTNSKSHGISMLIPGSKYIKDKELLANSRKAGKDVLEAVIASTGAKSIGLIERTDLTGFNWSKVPSILIEMGFMTNPEEDRKLADNEYRKLIARGMADGVVKYFKVGGQ